MIGLSNETMRTILTFIVGHGSELIGLLSFFALQLRNVSWEFIRTAEIPNAGISYLLSLGLIATGQENLASVTTFQIS